MTFKGRSEVAIKEKLSSKEEDVDPFLKHAEKLKEHEAGFSKIEKRVLIRLRGLIKENIRKLIDSEAFTEEPMRCIRIWLKERKESPLEFLLDTNEGVENYLMHLAKLIIMNYYLHARTLYIHSVETI